MTVGAEISRRTPLLMKQGADWSLILRYKVEDSADVRTPVDISGYTIRCKMKQSYEDSTALFDLSTDNAKIAITDAENGEFTLTLTDTETAAAPIPLSQGKGGVPSMTLVFDIELVNLSGIVIPFLIGTVKILAEVTN